jgi:hypothetical protein
LTKELPLSIDLTLLWYLMPRGREFDKDKKLTKIKKIYQGGES